MVVAAVNDNWYNVVLLLHLLSVIIGTGAAFLAPVLLSLEQKQSKSASSPISSLLGTVMSPALLLGGVFGGALVGMSEDVYDFGQTWLAIGGGLWLLAVGSAALAFPPSFITLPDLTGKRALLYGTLHISLAVMLILMVWKPGY
tara:strand:- start:16855 stop:17286 length:432 start_codon:yes stop_codon:yes gene_type:complete